MALGEPSPLTEPLPGGKKRATVRLHPLLSAEMLSPPEFLAMTPGRLSRLRALGLGVRREHWLRVPIPAFLVEHPGVGPILIDTGYHQSVAIDPKQNLGRLFDRLYTITMEPEQAIAAQLRGRGIEPGDIGVIVMTHLHLDHASAICDFTGATYVLGQGEWAAVHAPRALLAGYVRRHVRHAVDYREVAYGHPSIDSYSTFGRSFDLFGDGSVRLVYTPGHTAGHQSLILRLKNREVLVTGDAIYSLATLDHGRRGYALADEHDWRRSLREIQLYRRENPGALIIPGHDPDAWGRLEPSYV